MSRVYSILNDCLVDVPMVVSPNTDEMKILPEALVVHYTAGGSNGVSVLTAPGYQASAHLVISREGAVTQLLPFTVKAWHAGVSEWQGRKHLNGWSVGIELENWGYLEADRSDPSVLRSWSKTVVTDAVEARHRNGGRWTWWERFPAAQIDAALWVARAICRAYGIGTVVGHDEVSPGRKWDPGPAFPMVCFRKAVGVKTLTPAPLPGGEGKERV